ncbi:dentin sialophosphoprotein-like [Haliotis asinina]|uniref:dentin sialophosphoprotein-like n=1 Tax=Haliotis asinina TaxID=109174 RepID=UPI003531C614
MSDENTREAQDKTEEYTKEENPNTDSQQRDSDVQQGEEKGGTKSERKNSSDRNQNEQTDTESATAMDALEPESGHDGSNDDGSLPNTGSKPVSKDSMDEEKVSVGSDVEQTGSAMQRERDELGDHVDDRDYNQREKSPGEQVDAKNSSSDFGSRNIMPVSEDKDTDKSMTDKGRDIALGGDNHGGINKEAMEGSENELQSKNDGSGDEENKADDVTTEISQSHSQDPDQSQEDRSDKEESYNRLDERMETVETQAKAHDQSVPHSVNATPERSQTQTEKPDTPAREDEHGETVNTRMDTNESNPSQTQTLEETSDSRIEERNEVRSEHIQPLTEDPDQVPQERSDEGDGDADSGAGLDDKASGLSEEGSAAQSPGDESRGEERAISNLDDKVNVEELQETGSSRVDERPEQLVEHGHTNQECELQQGNDCADADERLPRIESENGSLNVIGTDSTEAKDSRGNDEDNKRESWQRDIDSRENQESSSLDGRKKDENGDYEFETSSLSHTESEATRGQPPISTVYVLAPRKQSDPEPDTAHSQDEIEIVSEANRQDCDQQEVPKEEAGKETDATEDVEVEVEEKVEDKVGDEVKQEVREDVAKDDVGGEQSEVGVESDGKAEEKVESDDQSEVIDNDEVKDMVGKDIDEDGEVGERDKAENNEVVEEELEVEHRKESITHESVKDDELDKEVNVESEVTDKVEGGQDRVENDVDEGVESEEEEDSSSEDEDGTSGDSEDGDKDDKKSALVPGETTVQSTEVQAGQETESDARGNTRKESTVSDIPPPAASDKSEASIKDEERGTQPEEERISIKEDSKSIRSTRSAQSRGSLGKSRQSLRASRISVEKDVQPEVKDAPVDAAQAPRAKGEEDELDKKSVATSRASLTEIGTGDNNVKADSKSTLSQERNEKDDTTTHTNATDDEDKEPRQSSVSKPSVQSQEKEPVRDAKRYENRQEKKKAPSKSDGRGRAMALSPRRSSSPQRSRGSYRSEVKSARRSPRETSSSRTRSPTRPRTTTTSRSNKELDGRSKQREFFKEELKRLEEALKREKSKIIKPDVKKHTPYIFNTLEPYYNTSTVRYLVELPEEVQHRFVSRKTAIGLCDPWVDYSMDTQFLPRISSSSSSRAVNRHHEMEKRDEKIREREKRSKKEGSTRLPKFPVVTLDSKEYATKALYYSDVPELRRELRDKYSQNATKKIDEDYTRTKQDFYRMDLDKLDEVHPLNRPHMRNAYFAYLQNTPGSRKAVVECVKGLKAEGKAN